MKNLKYYQITISKYDDEIKECLEKLAYLVGASVDTDPILPTRGKKIVSLNMTNFGDVMEFKMTVMQKEKE